MKEWYRHTTTGDRGFLIEQRGDRYIVYDRPDQKKKVRYVSSEWIPDQDRQPFPKLQVAELTYGADRLLCRMLNHQDVRKDWLSLTPEQKLDWSDRGPEGGARVDLRREMHEALLGVLK